MSYDKAINEIASLLTQGGAPANHSQDVAARLSYALEDYFNYRLAQGNKSEVSGSESNNAAFRRAFRQPEEYPGGEAGDAGKDGEWAWAVGKDGKDGDQGDAGQDGTGRDGTDGSGGAGGGGKLNFKDVPCKEIEQKLKDCGIQTGGCNCDSSCNPTCCPGYGGTGMLNGQSLCAVVDAHARFFKDIRDRLDKIEKMLKDTVDCP